MLSCAGKRSHRHTILHVSFSNSFGLASARPTPQGLSGAPNIARYFDNGQGNRMLVIYEERAISLLVQLMAQTEDDGIKTMVYVFSPGADPYTDDFEDVAERVKLCALPSAIYEAYKRVLPKRKPKFLDEALQEMKAQAEAEANMQQTLDFGENDNMNEEGGEA